MVNLYAEKALGQIQKESPPIIRHVYNEGSIEKLEISPGRFKGKVSPGTKGKVYFIDSNMERIIADIEVTEIMGDGTVCAKKLGGSKTIKMKAGDYIRFYPEAVTIHIHSQSGFEGTGNAEDISTLIYKLTDTNSNIRWNAADALVKIGKPAVELLIVALKDESPEVRKCAIWALREIKDARAVDPLIILLSDKDINVSGSASGALVKIGSLAVERLIVIMKEGEKEARKHATVILGDIKDARAVDPLINAIKDIDPHIQWSAADSLVKIGKSAIALLHVTLRNDTPNVRMVSAWALGELNDISAIDLLINAVKDKNPDVRWYATESLEKIGPLATEVLLKALKERNLEILAGAYAFFIRKGITGSEDILSDALNKYGIEEMAAAFVSCGNNSLKASGELWKRMRGFKELYFPLREFGSIDTPRWGVNKK